MILESKERIDSILAGVKLRTGKDVADLTEAVQALCSTLDDILYGQRAINLYNEKVTKIRQYAFYYSSNLVSVDCPSVEDIGSYAFYYCKYLTRANFPLVTSIGSYAFRSCSSLIIVDFPLITKINNYTFHSCTSLKAVILRQANLVSLAGTNAFTSSTIASGTGYVYVPRSRIDSYKTATNWTTYANQFRALEDYTVDGTITGALDENKI